MAMNETLRHLEVHKEWLEMFEKPLAVMRQELVSLIHDEKEEVH